MGNLYCHFRGKAYYPKLEKRCPVQKTNIKKYLKQDTQGLIAAILEEPFWIHSLETHTPYTRFEDDSVEGNLTVSFSPDGDGWIQVHSRPDSKELRTVFRFRTPFQGGGKSPRVRNALLILAEAIRLDNKECPQKQG